MEGIISGGFLSTFAAGLVGVAVGAGLVLALNAAEI
jgi:hypothetical protein